MKIFIFSAEQILFSYNIKHVSLNFFLNYKNIILKGVELA